MDKHLKPTPKLTTPLEFNKIMEAYTEDISQTGVSVLLLGKVGAGKSFFALTCPKPVYIDVFDPEGAKGLRNQVGPEHGIFPDVRWSRDNISNPHVARDWRNEMNRRLSSDFFSQLGTYILDSSTMWAEAIAADIMKRKGMPGKLPDSYKDHWKPQKEALRQGIAEIVAQPCHVIITGHLKPVYTGKSQDKVLSHYNYNTVGDLAEYVPAQFSEIWLMEKKPDGANKYKYQIRTDSAGKYECRSRLKADGVLDILEPADFKAILRKAGYPHEDKPW